MKYSHDEYTNKVICMSTILYGDGNYQEDHITDGQIEKYHIHVLKTKASAEENEQNIYQVYW